MLHTIFMMSLGFTLGVLIHKSFFQSKKSNESRGVSLDERRDLIANPLPINSIVDEAPRPDSPVNYWLQVYGEFTRDMTDIWELTGSVNMPFDKNEYLKFNRAASRMDKNASLLGDLFYKEKNKELIKKMDF